VALAVAGFLVTRRVVPLDLRESHNSNIVAVFGALYVIYGLVVGFSAYTSSPTSTTPPRGPPRRRR
jgi:hypothetical protein